ncbi:MAG: hypothetical protein ACYC26_14935 [Phycisphaerales bacterium]
MSNAQVRRVLSGVRPVDGTTLRGWLRAVLGVEVPVGRRCEGHGGPMEYLEWAFFEDRGDHGLASECHPVLGSSGDVDGLKHGMTPSSLPGAATDRGERGGDVVVWANRGGGKTFYGAVATLLDLVFKPGVSVRILGGSMEQSQRMYEHLRSFLERDGLRELVAGKLTQRGVRLINGSEVELLAQAQTSVRGQRVQKLRCDEAELFDEEVWKAAQFVTRSKRCGDVQVRGTVEVFSTMHRPGGLMEKLVPPEVWDHGLAEDGHPVLGGDGDWKVIRWCAMDVLERCGAERDCATCGLWDVCGGRAKRGDGFLSLDDVLSQRRRSSAAAFESEMLCRRPSRSDAVFPQFDPATHVRAVERDESLELVGGMDFGIRCPTVMLWAQVRIMRAEARTPVVCVEVLDEYVASDRVMSEHLRWIERREWGRVRWVGVDPAGNQRNDQTGLSNVAMLRREGWTVRSVSSRLAEGIEAIRRRLDPRKEKHDSSGLIIHPRCERLIESLRTYHYDPRKLSAQEPVKDGPDHAVDALRYLVVNLECAKRGRVEVRKW